MVHREALTKFATKLESIHKRMADVTEEEALEALLSEAESVTIAVSAVESFVVSFSEDDDRRRQEFVSTLTAASRA
jgi:hypothetical protein